MKKFWLKALFTVIVVIFVLTLVPSTILALLAQPQDARMEIDVGRSGEVSTFYLYATGYSGQNWYFGIIEFEGSIEEFWKLTPEEQDKYLLETRDGTIDSDDWSTEINITLPAGSYYACFLIGDQPAEENIVDTKTFVVADRLIGNQSTESTTPVWVRTMPMTCWQIYVNEAGNFEFIFWWEYGNNNWVKIYDMDGNLVYEVDFLYGEPRFEVDLPDGMYTVKTYHDGFETPIQEFIIGKH